MEFCQLLLSYDYQRGAGCCQASSNWRRQNAAIDKPILAAFAA
ncbi:hypothetical protein [Herpetosiphon sp. NSE202]